jgi:hypothetical protein
MLSEVTGVIEQCHDAYGTDGRLRRSRNLFNKEQVAVYGLLDGCNQRSMA